MALVTSLPLFVDLNGTLIKAGLLVESYIHPLKQDPFLPLKAALWLLRGKAYLKERIAEGIALDRALLPYDLDLLDYLRVQCKDGKFIW
jgi:hypothetical protein